MLYLVKGFADRHLVVDKNISSSNPCRRATCGLPLHPSSRPAWCCYLPGAALCPEHATTMHDWTVVFLSEVQQPNLSAHFRLLQRPLLLPTLRTRCTTMKTLPSLLNNPRATQVNHPGLLISLPAGDSGIMTDGHLPLLSAQASACSGGAAK